MNKYTKYLDRLITNDDNLFAIVPWYAWPMLITLIAVLIAAGC